MPKVMTKKTLDRDPAMKKMKLMMEGKSMAGRPARLDHTQVLYPAYNVANVPRVPTEIWKSRE